MKISHAWLNEYIDVRLKPAELADGLSMLGLEVAGFEDLSRKFAGFVVGEVLERAKHPNADRLSLCKVNVGSETLQIVCGAPNVAGGQKVAVGLVGAVIPHNQHDPGGAPFTLAQVHIRGVQSNGMICSESELGLGDDASGIIVLRQSAKPGTSLATYLGMDDVVYDMEITANRGDWLSHIGVAREIQLLGKKKASLPKIRLHEENRPVGKAASVRIHDHEKCRRYAARVITTVNVGSSPQWMQDRLNAVGLRPINNVVDITNYVLMETGQPLHAFDYDLLAGHRIEVRCAEEGEAFTTLDGKTHTLKSDSLMIRDGEKPVALAGVMGGLNSEITDTTKTVLLESANFQPGNIRRTAKYLGASTDASQRFERGVDIDMCTYAVDRAAQLLQEFAQGSVLKGRIDVYPVKLKQRVVTLRIKRANDVLGTNLTKQAIVGFLGKLGLKVAGQAKGAIRFVVPTFRYDLVEEIDLIEEVARAYGYDQIETKTRTMVDFSKPLHASSVEEDLRSYLVGAGFNEILTYSLQDRSRASLGGGKPVEVLNPVSIEASALRTALIGGALGVVQNNRAHGQKDLRMFEIGNTFGLLESGAVDTLEHFRQEDRLLILMSGKICPQQYGSENRQVDFYDIKGELQALLFKFNLDKYRLISYDSVGALIESALAVEINGTYAGFLGKIGKSIAQRFDIDEDVYVCELSVELLTKGRPTEKKLKPLPRFPSVHRDLAFVVDAALEQESVARAIREAGGTLLANLVLFDVYVGNQVGAGRKSLAYSLEFQPLERTLTDKETDETVSRIVAFVGQTCEAKLRAL